MLTSIAIWLTSYQAIIAILFDTDSDSDAGPERDTSEAGVAFGVEMNR